MKMNSFEELTIEQVSKNLKKWAADGDRLMIISHRSPDGDTLGSAFALKMIYEALGGEAECRCKSEGAPFLRFLYSDQEEITYSEGDEAAFDRLVSVDVASPYQLGATIEPISYKIDMMLDHHERGEIFADYYIDAEASAAGEIICDIYTDLQLYGDIMPNPEIAKRIFSAISADTGSFKFSNVTPKTHLDAATLLADMKEGNIDASEIARVLHDSYTVEDLKARMLATKNLKLECDGRLAYVVITNEMLQSEGLSDDNTGSIVDIPRSVEGALVSLSIKQNLENPEEFRISSRSNSEIDVAEICAKFGGGGHKKAAGGRVIAKTAKEAVQRIVSEFISAVESYSEGK